MSHTMSITFIPNTATASKCKSSFSKNMARWRLQCLAYLKIAYLWNKLDFYFISNVSKMSLMLLLDSNLILYWKQFAMVSLIGTEIENCVWLGMNTCRLVLFSLNYRTTSIMKIQRSVLVKHKAYIILYTYINILNLIW